MTSAQAISSSSSRRGTWSEASIEISRSDWRTTSCGRSPGLEPAERASCPGAARRKSRSAITERPWFPTQTNRTFVTSCSSRSRCNRSRCNRSRIRSRDDLRDSDDGHEALERLVVEAEVGPLAALLAIEQARLGQLLQVVAHRRLGEAERRLERARADGLAGGGEHVEDLHAGRIAQRAEERGGRVDLVLGQRRRGKRAAAIDQGKTTHRRPSIYRRASIRVKRLPRDRAAVLARVERLVAPRG